MQKRGRKSSAELAVISSEVIAIPRPDAPYDLTDEQAEEWWAVVNRMPPEWFPRETHALLAEFCRHVVTARRVAELVKSLEGKKALDIGAYDRALRMQERESRCISSLATKMRISQQTTYDKSKKKPQTIETGWHVE